MRLMFFAAALLLLVTVAAPAAVAAPPGARELKERLQECTRVVTHPSGPVETVLAVANAAVCIVKG